MCIINNVIGLDLFEDFNRSKVREITNKHLVKKEHNKNCQIIPVKRKKNRPTKYTAVVSSVGGIMLEQYVQLAKSILSNSPKSTGTIGIIIQMLIIIVIFVVFIIGCRVYIKFIKQSLK